MYCESFSSNRIFEATTVPIEKDVIIAVMGATGTGKSAFINTAVSLDLPLPKRLRSDTKGVATVSFPYRHRKIVLVHMPGFDDSFISDMDTLQSTVDWFSEGNGRPLNGVVYLHGIAEEHVSTSSHWNMKLFHEICGKYAMKNAILCTKIGDSVEASISETREPSLLGQLWDTMMIQGARLARHNGTRESALRIIDQLLELQPVWLDIQVSFAEGKSLVETAAGKWINKELLQLQGTQQKDPGWLAKELKGAPRSKHHKPQVLFSSELGWPKDEAEKTVQEKQGLFTASLMEDSALPTGMYKNPRSKLTGLIATIDQTTKELKVKKIESKQSTSFTFSPVHVLSRNTPSEHLGILTKTSLSLEQSIEINDKNVEDELRRVCALYRQFMEQPSPELTDARKLVDEQHRLLKALLVKTVRDKY